MEQHSISHGNESRMKTGVCTFEQTTNPKRVSFHTQLVFWVTIFSVFIVPVPSHLRAQQWPLGHQPRDYVVPQYGINPVPASTKQNPTQESASPTGRGAPEVPIYPLYDISEPPASSQTPLVESSPESSQTTVSGSATTSLINSPTTLLPPQPVDGPQKNQQDMRFIRRQPHYGLDDSVYRDFDTYPVDPRKRCNVCTHPPIHHGICPGQWPGKNGRPYKEIEPGGCRCSPASSKTHGNFSFNWPAPFSSSRSSHRQTNSEGCGTERKRINDYFTPLANFKVIDYRRTDSGYSGVNCDPYGCPGESRVVGIGLRHPGAPAVAPFPPATLPY
jgi:hypothetical protein